MGTEIEYEAWLLTKTDTDEVPSHLADWHRKYTTPELEVDDREALLKMACLTPPDASLSHHDYELALKDLNRQLDQWHREHWPYTTIRYRLRGRPRQRPFMRPIS